MICHSICHLCLCTPQCLYNSICFININAIWHTDSGIANLIISVVLNHCSVSVSASRSFLLVLDDWRRPLWLKSYLSDIKCHLSSHSGKCCKKLTNKSIKAINIIVIGRGRNRVLSSYFSSPVLTKDICRLWVFYSRSWPELIGL